MSEITAPLLRMAYKHTPTGKIYVVWGICKQFRDKSFPDDNDIVILASLHDGEPQHYPLAKFWDKNPNTGETRFQLITPA